MNPYEPTSPEPTLSVRHSPDETDETEDPHASTPLQALRRRIFFRTLIALTALALILSLTAFFAARFWAHKAMRDSLPQLDGNLAIAGLSAPVTIQRDAHGVPYIRAASLDDLLIAQGFVTAGDRLWQMDLLRRHAAGELAEILGPALIPHDRVQRTLQIRAAADRALSTLTPDQLHQLQSYAQGVNDAIEAQRPHLPIEFRVLRYQPAPWTPRDSILVGLSMFQDLTNSFPQKLNREALTAKLPAELLPDLYPVGSWRDHPPTQPTIDLTAPQTDIPDIPLDNSQSRVTNPGAPSLDSEMWASLESANAPAKARQPETASTQDLLTIQQTLAPILTCEGCTSGSNNWAVSGIHTATGKPLLSNDMHLAHNVPGIWYEADLQSPTPTGEFHVTGLSLPGVPFIIVGHNAHLAWGFTNLGADVQDIYIEHTRGSGPNAEYETSSGAWQPLLHHTEIIHVRSGKDITLDVPATQHGDAVTPIISGSILPTEKRTLSLRWTIYDPANITPSFYAIDAATDWPSLHAAFSTFGGPAQNLVFADDQGHIGYHAVGRIPIRGSLAQPSPLSPVPVDALDTTQNWAGYIPFDQLPQAFDPPGGILATANARVTPDDYTFPITLNWTAPYRNERIWKVLSTHEHLTPADMLTLQTDVYSDLDHVLAQRFAYAIDHSTTPAHIKDKRLHQAADLLRNWNGNVDATAAAPAIVDAARDALWPLLLNPHLGPHPGNAADLYTWGEKSYAEEQIIMHTPSRWLPSHDANWNDLLTTAVAEGLIQAHAPINLTRWQYGHVHPVDIEHPLFKESPLLQHILDLPTGTGIQPQSGDATTVKQVGRIFGPSERFTADLADLDRSTLNIVLGQSANPASPWFKDQWPAWYKGTTYPLPFTNPAVDAATTHTLTLTPQ